jgi:hypothetical protein
MLRTSIINRVAALAAVAIGAAAATPAMAQFGYRVGPGYAAPYGYPAPGYAAPFGYGGYGYGYAPFVDRCLQDEGYGRYTPCDGGGGGGT